MCDNHDEIIEHMLYTRSNFSGIWEDKVQFINNVYESRIKLNRFSVLSGFLVNDESNVIMNGVIAIARFEIWRNVFRHESIFVSPMIIVGKIKYDVKCYFKILAKKTFSKYVERCIEQIQSTHPYSDSWYYTMTLIHHWCDKVFIVSVLTICPNLDLLTEWCMCC